jgi:DNA polymerase-3 subunit epsilon
VTLDEVLSLERPLVGLDLETTGVSPQSSRIVELGLEIMTPGKPTKDYRTYLNPGMPIPPSATAVHHITDALVATAPTFAQLADNLLKGFANADFAGYNIRFDLRMLAAEFKRCGRTWNYEDARILDAFRFWQIIEARSLEDAARRWQVEAVEGQAHNALWDAKMATRVIAAQLRGCAKLPRNLQMLHDLCSPGWVDAEGKLQWKDGALVFTFGEHRDKPLPEVPRAYFAWILKKDFSERVKEICREAMKGVFPSPPTTDSSM